MSRRGSGVDRLRPPVRAKAVPEWFITWGDLMSLLLCFFVLLQVFSEVKKDEEYVRVVGGIQHAFGFSGGVERTRIAGDDYGAIIQLFGGTTARGDEGTVDDGSHAIKLRRTGEGLEFTVGGQHGFAAESAEMSPAMRAQLAKLAAALAGRRNRIVIRGHAANKYLSNDSPWRDLNELSYARARAVMEVLVEEGIDEGYCRLEAAGRWEPARERDGGISSADRRVEIILTDEIADALGID